MKSVFLSAYWKNLAMINYEVDPAILRPYVPRGTELDLWNGRCYISMVGFMFLDTRLLGLPIPLHQNFEEVNLRFYVRHQAEDGWRRGVVFIKELVPRWAIATTAKLVYNENYQALPMTHTSPPANYATPFAVSYGWRFNKRWHEMGVTAVGDSAYVAEGSEAEFITEHYWGYAAQRDGGTVEYQVEHPSWRVWLAGESHFQCDVSALYGSEFAEPLMGQPTSAFLAEGSEVIVRVGGRIA